MKYNKNKYNYIPAATDPNNTPTTAPNAATTTDPNTTPTDDPNGTSSDDSIGSTTDESNELFLGIICMVVWMVV